MLIILILLAVLAGIIFRRIRRSARKQQEPGKDLMKTATATEHGFYDLKENSQISTQADAISN